MSTPVDAALEALHISTEPNPVTDRGRMAPAEYDAVLLASFGGPEGQDDVAAASRTSASKRSATTTAHSAASAPSTSRTVS